MLLCAWLLQELTEKTKFSDLLSGLAESLMVIDYRSDILIKCSQEWFNHHNSFQFLKDYVSLSSLIFLAASKVEEE